MAKKTKKKKTPGRSTRAKPVRLRRVLWSIVGIVAILSMLPLVFMAIYRLPGAEPVSTLMFARAITGQEVIRDWVSLDDVAPVMLDSIVMSEDGKYCAHKGVDWEAINTVIDDALDGEKTRGASTIAMQTMKNLFLWPQRSFIRKGLEVPLALLGDRLWRKRRLMEIYVNIAEWDDGIYGIEAAARHYFGKPSADLTRREAALLAVTLPNPKARNPAKPSRSLARLAGTIEARARKAGGYTVCLK